MWAPDIATVDEFGNFLYLDWAACCLPPGINSVPKVGNGVWVEFQHGDIDRPIVVGVWYGQPQGQSQFPVETRSGEAQCTLSSEATLRTSDENDAVEVSAPVPDNEVEYPGPMIIGGDSGFLSFDDANETITLQHRKGNKIVITKEGITFASNGRIRNWAVEDIEMVTDRFNTSTNDPVYREMHRIFKPTAKGNIKIEVERTAEITAQEFNLTAALGKFKFKNGKIEILAGPNRRFCASDEVAFIMGEMTEIIAKHLGTAFDVVRLIKAQIGKIELETLDGEINIVTGVGVGTQVVNIGARAGTDFLLKATTFLADFNSLLTVLSAWAGALETATGVPAAPVVNAITAIQVNLVNYPTVKAKGI